MFLRQVQTHKIVLLSLCSWSVLVTFYFWRISTRPDLEPVLTRALLKREDEAPETEHSNVTAFALVRTQTAELQLVEERNDNELIGVGASLNTPPPIEDGIQISTTTSRHLEMEHNASTVGSKRERYKMVVGIVTALRKPPTILNLAKRLVQVKNILDYKLVVLQSYSAAGDAETKRALQDLGYEVFTMATEYEELIPSRLRITWNDPPSRVKWRTNHVLDYAYLLEKTLEYEADFVMILEDDMMPAVHALDKAYKSLSTDLTIPHQQLGYVAFYSGIRSAEPRGLKRITGNLGIEGACTLTFAQTLVPAIINHLKSDPYANPVDMAIGWLVDKELKLESFDRIPHLFQHGSMKSTYTESDQIQRKTEEARSTYFLHDEDNYTLHLHPSESDGYVGCYMDHNDFSDLSGFFKFLSDNGELLSSCRDTCKQYLFFGLQRAPGGIECHCGNEFGYYGTALESECSTCGSTNETENCGSFGRNSIYRVEPFRATLVGCFKDGPGQRDLEHYVGDKMTPMMCANACSKYKYFGVQSGGECYCGDTHGRYGSTDIKACMVPCATDSRLFCGGSWTNIVFKFM